MQGAKTLGRVPREVTVSVSIALATALTGESTTSMVFRDAAEAGNGAIEVAGSSAAAAADQYQSAVRLQNMTGQVKHSGCCGLGASLQPRRGDDNSPAATVSCCGLGYSLRFRICMDQSPDAPVSHT